MRLLLTAFEPFAGEAVNPSSRVLDALRGHLPAGIEGALLELPVQRARAAEELLRAWTVGGFEVWLGLGQAGGRPEICLERMARNAFCALPEPGAAPPTVEVVRADRPRAYRCRWPAVSLQRALAMEGWPVRISHSAGTYVCNEVLFAMQHQLRARVSPTSAWAGFVHLPYLPEQLEGKDADVPALALEAQVQVVRRILEWLRDARASQQQVGQEAQEHPGLAQRRG